ncbi:MAG TPA: substrate-binding domain-containing protein [Pseudolysinimonas sp.]|nr:substrate-binding domain-containing protein [Pseudolysinimonas sp.]
MLTKKNTLRFGVIAAAAAAALAFGSAAPAFADPSGFKTLAGVGSDTTENLVNGLGTVVTTIGSYDATGSANIQTRSGGVSFARPNGSGNGQKALSASINPGGTHTWPAAGGVDITGQIDFARSSSAPSASLPGTDLTFIPFARDAVSYAVSAASDFPRDVALGSSTQDTISPAPFTLRNIYRGTVTTYVDADFSSVTIRPLLPQAGSGTRSFWISKLGLTEAQISSGGVATDLGGTVQEHNGTFVTQPGDLVPFSVAQFIQQGNHAALPTLVDERRGNIVLGNIGSAKPYIPSTGGGIELNPAFPVNRLVYNVVSTPRLTGTSAADLALQAAFKGSSSSVCSASATIKQYGFGTIGSTCGSTTATQAFTF